MGHFVGAGNRQGFVHEDGCVYTDSHLSVKIAESEALFLNGTDLSLIVPKLPDGNGEIVYGGEQKEEVKELLPFQCDLCGTIAKSKAGLASHKRFNHKG